MSNTETLLRFKVNDIFSFRFNESELKKRSYPWHCFDGQLIVRKSHEGNLYFADTYWSFGSCGDSKRFTIDELLKIGDITFVCSLDEVEEIKQGDLLYYAEDDVYNLSYQNGCYKRYAKKRGAVRSQAKMIESATEKLEDAIYRKAKAERDIEEYKKTISKIEAGDTTLYI